MFRLLWAISVRTRYFLRRYMPTNIALDAIRTRRGLKWGLPAMLLALPYLGFAALCVNLINDGGPDWVNILVLLFCWNALKFVVIGPLSVIWLARVRIQEWSARVAMKRHVESEPLRPALADESARTT